MGQADWTFGENLADFDPANVVVKDGYMVLVLSKSPAAGFNGVVPKDDLLTMLDSPLTEHTVQAFPNPATSKLFVNNQEKEWVLYDSFGTIVSKGTSKEIEMEKFVSGVYFLHLNNSVQKILKR